MIVINEFIQRENIQNIHDVGNGNFVIEYEEDKHESRRSSINRK